MPVQNVTSLWNRLTANICFQYNLRVVVSLSIPYQYQSSNLDQLGVSIYHSMAFRVIVKIVKQQGWLPSVTSLAMEQGHWIYGVSLATC